VRCNLDITLLSSSIFDCCDLILMMVHPGAVAAVTEGGRFRTDLDDARDENGYG
jgi:hypothetical protein